MLFRYTILIALAGLSLYAVVVTGASTSQALLAQSAGDGDVPNYGLWVLTTIVCLSTFSLCRFVLHGIPSMLTEWFYEHRDWLCTLFLGGLVLIVFYWL